MSEKLVNLSREEEDLGPKKTQHIINNVNGDDSLKVIEQLFLDWECRPCVRAIRLLCIVYCEPHLM